MATWISHLLKKSLPALRYEPTSKRVRAFLGGEPVADTTEAVLVWEPQRVVPIYAVPESDVLAGLAESRAKAPRIPQGTGVLGPDEPFGLHTTEGNALDLNIGAQVLEAAAFRLADPGLAGMVLLDFGAFDWMEEEAPIHGHPRDPFHRIDIIPSSRTVRVESEGTVLAESGHPVMLFETNLPARCYIPPNEVVWDRLAATAATSICPYKGTATYWSTAGGGPEVAWSYKDPLPGAAALAGLVCFYPDRVDVVIDGHRVD